MGFLSQRLTWFQSAAIFFLAVIQYSNTANHDYAWDDAIVITQNTRVQKGLSNIPELFENIKSEKTENRYGYRPIALLSFATDVEFFGFDPKASHRVNILLYGLLCALIFFFVNSLFPVAGSNWAVWAVTALFVVHPLHTEVVANIKSRDEILAMLFGLGALLSVRKGLLSGKWLFYLLSIPLFILSFNSKESGITFCGVALLMSLYAKPEVWPNWRKMVGGVLVALGSLAALLFIRSYVYSEQFFQTNDWDLIHKGMFIQDGFVGNPLWDASFSERLATALYISGYSLYRFIVPFPSLHDYSYNVFPVRTWSDMEVYLAGAVVLVFAVITIYGLVRRKAFGFGLAFYFITLSIYLHLVHIGPDIFAERYTFVPSLGLCIALLSVFSFKWISKDRLVIAVLIGALPLSVYSWQRNKVWKDNETLLVSDLEHLGDCARANYNYGLYLHGKYYELPKAKQPAAREEILLYYKRALEITDRIFKVYMDLGSAYMEFGKPDEAYAVFLESAEKYPNLSMPFVQLGKYYMSFSDFEKALPNFEKAIENGSSNSDYFYFKAVCEVKTGAQDDAIATLEKGEALGASAAEYYILLTNLYMNKQDAIKASLTLEKGLKRFKGNNTLLELKKTVAR